jgi:PAS domain S-box-containing protein
MAKDSSPIVPAPDDPGDVGAVPDVDDLLAEVTAEGYLTGLNPAWETTLGFSLEELMGRPYIEFVHPEDRDATLAETVKIGGADGTNVEIENRYATRDGGWRWLSWRVRTRDGVRYSVARDVTQRVREDQHCRLLASIVEGAGDAIFSKTLDGVITSWNQGAEDLYGYSAREAVGRRLGDLFVPGGDRHESDEIVAHLLRGEGVRQQHALCHRKDGSDLSVAVTASLLRDIDGDVTGVAVVSRQIIEPDVGSIAAEFDTLTWIQRIREAIDDDRITFYAQPIVSLRGRSRSYELLCRMVARDGTVIPPGRFLPIAESYGLIEELDRLAIRQAAVLIGQGHAVNVNLSSVTLTCPRTIEFISEQLKVNRADPAKLTVELTETALTKDMTAAKRFTDALAALPARLSLDDFGTGFGSFTYLKKLKVAQLKIDVEFVRDLTSSPASEHVITAVVALAEGFGIETVAEGVETAEIEALLERHGVDAVQGHHVARPAPLADALGTPIASGAPADERAE